MKRLLVLRPEPGAAATVERARVLGLDASAVPLFEIEGVAWEAPDAAAFDGLLLTSANAVRFGGPNLQTLRGLPVFAVGEATADAAREAGVDIASAGDAGVERLLASIDPQLKLLHLCGEQRRTAQGASQAITPIVVYRSRAIDAPDLGESAGSVVLVHSPRAAERLAELVSERSSISVAAISEATAATLGNGWEAVETADRPTDDALLALAARLCNKPAPE
jgi:uroporphyrinogen-III synthase